MAVVIGSMRNLLLGSAFIFLIGFQPTIAQPPSVEAPALKPGEYWVWQWNDDFRGGNAHNDTFRRTMVRQDKFEGQDVYILSRGDGTFSVTTHDLITIATIDGTNNVKFRFVITGDNAFPLGVGKLYSRHTDNPIGKYRSDTKSTVTGTEQISTKAGSFTAFRVDFAGNGREYDGTAYTVSGTSYFASAAKAWVKTSYSTNTGYRYSEELVSYQVLP